MEARKKPSRWWYLLPLFLGIVGGLIGYVFVVDKDKKFARKLVIIGIVVTVILIAARLAVSAISYLYLRHAVKVQTEMIRERIKELEEVPLTGSFSFIMEMFR